MFAAAIFLARLFVEAWALQTLWNWFAVPLGAIPLAYWHAMGLDLFVSFLAMSAITYVEEDTDRRNGQSIAKLLASPIMVGCGWVILQIWRAA